MFEEGKLVGRVGVYPLTAENLLRVGLALCTLLSIENPSEKPLIKVKELNFISMAIATGFMAGGGDVFVGEGNYHIGIEVEEQGDEAMVLFEGLSAQDFKKLEAILFSRYNMPKKEGAEIGRLWIQN